MESLLTQTLIVQVIRTRRLPFVQSRASAPLLALTVAIGAIGAALPFTPLARDLGFVPLPPSYWPLLLAMLLGYVALTQGVKAWLIRRGWL